MKRLLLTINLIAITSIHAHSQVLITLIFGDKLNTDKLEFGLIGGLTASTLRNVADNPDAKYLSGFNLGFYFDIKLTEALFLNTGVLVKSPMGASGIMPYPLGDSDLDSVLVDSQVNRRLRYFHVPILARYYLAKPIFFIEGGAQVALMNKAFDEFTLDVFEKEDLVFKKDIIDQLNRIDAGLIGGLGFKLQKKLGMTIGARYYAGLLDIVKKIRNRIRP